ncbi:MAG: hypothetical protein NC341_02450 [Blautia sp.]|nr:hypothetical protein [Blautia sp.]MCM1200478.1 hypothetical protein [Bacteroides fragilis]
MEENKETTKQIISNMETAGQAVSGRKTAKRAAGSTKKMKKKAKAEVKKDDEEKGKKRGMPKGPCLFLMFLSSGIIAGAGSLLYGHSEEEIISNIVMILLGTGMVIFTLLFSEVNGLYYYANEGKYGKFVLFYIAALALTLIFPLLPVSGWPFLVVFVVFGLFSNSIAGLTAGSVCLMLPIMLGSVGSSREFMLYFFSGLVGILVFSRLNEDFKVGLPIFISLVCLAVCLSANIVLFEQERLSASQFTFVAINLMVNLIPLLIALKFFNGSVIHQYRDRYMDLNDPEFPLLVQLKEYDKAEYYRAIHTAYLGDRIAKRIGINDVVVKACGYYHRIGILKGENTWENVKEICEEYNIPEDTRKILKEYLTAGGKVAAKETTVLMFADCIVTTILDEFKKNPNAELNYKQIIDNVFNKKLETGALSESDISIAQMREMRKIFKAEQLYYDFLR